MKKFVLFVCAVITLSSFPVPSFALGPETGEVCEYNSVISYDDPACVAPEEPIPPLESSRALVVSEILARICPTENPGCDAATQKLGAFIEIYNESDDDFTLTGWTVQYAAASTNNLPGKWSVLANINVDLAAKNYLSLTAAVGDKTDGYVRIADENNQTVDLVGYGKAADLSARLAPKLALNKSVQRCELIDGSLDNFALYATPTPGVGLICPLPDEDDENENPPSNPTAPANSCSGLILSEIGANLDAQFIEVQNISATDLDIGGCRLMTNRSTSKYFTFADEILPSGGFKIINISETDLTLTKTTTGTVYLLNSDGSSEIDSIYYANLKSGTTFARVGETWQQTYATTPGTENLAQEFPACDEGYFRNLTTGKCNKIVEPAALAPCDEGYFRNPDTGRCKKLTVESVLAPCPEGQFRNPETNRCKKIATDDGLTPCKEGYERNPETNRCRKIGSDTDELTPCKEGYERNPETNRCRKIVSSTAAAYAIDNDNSGSGAGGSWMMMAGGIVVSILAVVAWQFRSDILLWLDRFKPQRKLGEGMLE